MNTKDAITKAIGAHGQWKQRLVDAINTGKSEWQPATVTQDNQCEFGKWLYACSLEEKTSPHHGRVKDLHASFHKTAAQVLTLALAGKKSEAEKQIALGSEYAKTSANLTKELMAWKSA